MKWLYYRFPTYQLQENQVNYKNDKIGRKCFFIKQSKNYSNPSSRSDVEAPKSGASIENIAMIIKQNNLSLVICGNITEFGVAEGSPEPARLFCFYILLFNGFKFFQAKIYEINMYLLLYLFF